MLCQGHASRLRWHWAQAWLLLLLLLPLAALAQAPVPVPTLDDPVVDTAGVLSGSTTHTLQQQARALHARTGGTQLQVLVVPTTGGEDIEGYAQRVFDGWALGRAGVDDGVLLLVAVQDRRVRIQTGYGLEGAIPDAYAKRIIEEAILPRFRDGDIDQGVLDGSALLVRLIDGEPLPAPQRHGLLGVGWSPADTLVLTTLLVAFGWGLWRSPRPAPVVPAAPAVRSTPHRRRRVVQRKRKDVPAPADGPPWWHRPLQWLGIVAAALLVGWAWLPAQPLLLAMALLPLVPLAWAFGRYWRRSPGTRRMLWFMLAISGVLVAGLLAWRQLVPGLLVHAVAYLLVAVASGIVSLPVMVTRERWRLGRLGFFVRLLVFLAMLAVAALCLRSVIPDRDSALGAALIGSFAAYVGWIVLMVAGMGGGGGRGRDDDDDDYRRRRRSSSSTSGSSRSSSSSSWSGGGGRSGGGGASGSW